MNIRKLAFSNIRRSLKKYAVYFFAMWFCIFTTYTFLALALSESVGEKLRDSANYQSVFIGFSIAILIFTLFFLISSNNSFIRARKKEISTYALFGMENSKIGRMLFLETLVLGAAALVSAILLGIFLSKLLTMILLKMVMSAYSGDIAFSIEPAAVIATCAIYAVIFVFMGLSGRRLVGRFQLADLFKGDKVSEGRSKGSYVMLVLSVVLIAAGYFFAVSPYGSVVVILMIPIIILVTAGTYLFFLGGFQKLMHLLKRNKKALYKKTRLVSTSLLSHCSRTMATMMATIAILVAVGTTAVAFGYTLFQNAESQTYDTSVFDVYLLTADEKLKADVEQVLEENSVEITGEITFARYESSPEIRSASRDFSGLTEPIGTFKQSEYNAIAAKAKSSMEQVDVPQASALIVYKSYFDVAVNDETKLVYGDTVLDAEYFESGSGSNFSNFFFVIVLGDGDYDRLAEQGSITKRTSDYGEAAKVVGINYEGALQDDKTAAALEQAIAGRVAYSRLAYSYYNELLGVFGLLCFVGFFMCTVFMLMTASMLYFKQITIATEEKKQYAMLRKIGMSAEEESAVVRKRLAPIFFFPLILGIIHSVFAMKGADTLIFTNLITSGGNTFLSVLKTSLVMYAAYTIVYAVFYFITKAQYKQAVK